MRRSISWSSVSERRWLAGTVLAWRCAPLHQIRVERSPASPAESIAVKVDGDRVQLDRALDCLG